PTTPPPSVLSHATAAPQIYTLSLHDALPIYAQVVARATTHFGVVPDVTGTHDMRKERTEQPRRAELSRVRDLERLQVGGFEVEPVRHHKTDAVALARLTHGLAIFHARGQRLLTQDVYAAFGGAHGKVPVLGVGRTDVHGIDARGFEHAFEIVVITEHFDGVALSELFTLFHVPRNQGH